LTFAKATHGSIRGPIASSWTLNRNHSIFSPCPASYIAIHSFIHSFIQLVPACLSVLEGKYVLTVSAPGNTITVIEVPTYCGHSVTVTQGGSPSALPRLVREWTPRRILLFNHRAGECAGLSHDEAGTGYVTYEVNGGGQYEFESVLPQGSY